MKKNIVLITADSLRPDRLGCYDYQRNTSPNINKLTEKGVIFKRAISTGSSTYSLSSIFSGTYPLMYGGYRFIERERPMIADFFSSKNYRTLGIHSNPFLSSNYNFHRGYDSYLNLLHDTTEKKAVKSGIRKLLVDRLSSNKFIYRLTRSLYRKINYMVGRIYDPRVDGMMVNKVACKWLDNIDNSFFIWLHYMDTHSPFYPPGWALKEIGLEGISNKMQIRARNEMSDNSEDMDTETVKLLSDLYDAEIYFFDSVICNLIEEFKSRDLWDETYFVITADHGEEFNEHGIVGHPTQLYDELLHVPLIITGGDISKRVSIKRTVSMVDLSPTMIELAGFTADDIPENMCGTSLMPLIRGRENYKISEPLSEISHVRGDLQIKPEHLQVALTTDKWKFIENIGNNKIELYNLEEDPGEKINLAEKNEKVKNKLASRVKKHLEENINMEFRDFDYSEDEIRQNLKDLGYL